MNGRASAGQRRPRRSGRVHFSAHDHRRRNGPGIVVRVVTSARWCFAPSGRRSTSPPTRPPAPCAGPPRRGATPPPPRSSCSRDKIDSGRLAARDGRGCRPHRHHAVLVEVIDQVVALVEAVEAPRDPRRSPQPPRSGTRHPVRVCRTHRAPWPARHRPAPLRGASARGEWLPARTGR